LQQFPDFRIRITNYQKARHAKLSDLTSRYRAALTDAKSRAPADAAAYDMALAEAVALMTEIEKNLTATEVRPLPALATTDGAVPQRLKELSDIFEKETAKLETGLVTDLDQSLSVVQASMTQAGRQDAAKALEDYRTQLAAVAFVMAGSKQPGALPSDSNAITSVLQATKEKPFVNSLGMKFVPVPGTKVLMCIHETRIRDYTVFAQQHPGVDMGWKVDRANRVQIIQGADHPVVLVSWSSAKAFCDWLSAKERQRYRLPTDREWSMAVGIGDGENTGQPSSDYPWGIQWPPPPGFGNYADSSATYRKPSENIAGYRDGFPYTAPVMSFPPNQHGIFDLGGNVCEACDDGGNDGQSSHNWRGGSYGEVESYKMQSSFRLARPHNYTSNHSGFRAVLELP
jgi:formylglycine-generating enzyme required for sulfatase activity